MKKSERLQTIVDLNAEQEKKSLEAFGTVQQKQLHIQAQLEQLSNYRKEYEEKYLNAVSSGVKMTQLLAFRSFIEQLDQAIAGQHIALERVDAELTASRNNWLGQHNRTSSLQKIQTKAVTDETKQSDKQEQLEQDDRVGARFGANGTGNA